MGGQTALNTALALFNDGTLTKDGVEMIGADAEAIDKAEDRQKFRDAMDRIGLESARSGVAHTLDEALAVLERTGLRVDRHDAADLRVAALADRALQSDKSEERRVGKEVVGKCRSRWSPYT